MAESVMVITEPQPLDVHKRKAGRPPKDEAVRHEEVFFLPEGMTDQILAWACGIPQTSPTIYRWRTGQSKVSDGGLAMTMLWDQLGKKKFMKSVAKTRGKFSDYPRRGKKKKPSQKDYILWALQSDEGTKSVAEIMDWVWKEHKITIPERSLRTRLSILKNLNLVEHTGKDEWKAAEGITE